MRDRLLSDLHLLSLNHASEGWVFLESFRGPTQAMLTVESCSAGPGRKGPEISALFPEDLSWPDVLDTRVVSYDMVICHTIVLFVLFLFSTQRIINSLHKPGSILPTSSSLYQLPVNYSG